MFHCFPVRTSHKLLLSPACNASRSCSSHTGIHTSPGTNNHRCPGWPAGAFGRGFSAGTVRPLLFCPGSSLPRSCCLQRPERKEVGRPGGGFPYADTACWWRRALRPSRCPSAPVRDQQAPQGTARPLPEEDSCPPVGLLSRDRAGTLHDYRKCECLPLLGSIAPDMLSNNLI